MMGEVAEPFFEQVPDAVIGVDTRGLVRIVNRHAEDLFGWKREELLGSPIDRLLPERFRDAHRGEAHDFTRSPHNRSMGTGLSLYALRRDGTEFPVDIALAPILTARGVLVMSFVRDLTSRRKLEADLAEAMHKAALVQVEERFRKAFESSPAGMFICTMQEGTIIDVNESFTASLGFTRDEAVGRTFLDLGFWPSDGIRVAFLQRLRSTASLRAEEVEVRAKSGDPRFLLMSVETIEYGGERLFLGLFHDRTEERATERLREELIDLVSHELRTPATVIQGYGEILGSGGVPPGSSEAQAALAHIQRASKHLGYLLAEVLELVRLRAGFAALEITEFDAGALIMEALDVLESRRPDEMREPRVAVPRGSTRLRGDRRKLLMAVVEIVENALRCAPQGSEVEIAVEASASGTWSITVSDRGPGFPRQVQERLGQPFLRSAARRGPSGPGLGLALVVHIARAHGGDLAVEPRPGGGSVVRLTVPPGADSAPGPA